MCGIAGIITAEPGRHDTQLLWRLSQRMAHRGPDDVGFLQWSRDGNIAAGRGPRDLACNVVLLHRRLAVFDPSDASRQPMSSSDGRYHLVFNGALYNYVELREQLQAAGHVFSTTGDTEVLLAALVEWGPGALEQFIGMFAFALLDTREQTLLLARDPFGIKPLYYTLDDHRFAFASEMKLLLELPGIPRAVNPNRLYEFLRYGITDYGEQTMVGAIRQVAAGTHLTLPVDRPNGAQRQTYWQVDHDTSLDIGFDAAATRLRELFLESVRLQMRSDVPLGACLSGGMDSSAIVAAMRHVAGGELDLHAFTYVADDDMLNERRYAEVAAAAVNAEVHLLRVEPTDLVADVDALIENQDEPFGSTSIYAQRRVFQAARQHGMKVMLDGQGGDEIFGGYRYFVAGRVASLLREGRLVAARQMLTGAAKLPASGRTPSTLLHALGLLLPASLHPLAMQLIGEDPMPEWLNARWFAAHNVVAQPPSQPAGPDYMRGQLAHSVKTISLPALLRYEDRNAMAFSIESRVPILTPAITEFMFSLPESYLIGENGESKKLFRAAMRGIVPDVILDRRDKLGFATPERSWLAALQPMAAQVLAGEFATQIPAIENGNMQAAWEAVQRTGGPVDFRYWRWLNFIRWAERFQITFP